MKKRRDWGEAMEGNSEMAGKDLCLKLVDEMILLLSDNNLVKYIYLFVWPCASGFSFIIKVKDNKVKQKRVPSHSIVIFNVITL